MDEDKELLYETKEQQVFKLDFWNFIFFSWTTTNKDANFYILNKAKGLDNIACSIYKL